MPKTLKTLKRPAAATPNSLHDPDAGYGTAAKKTGESSTTADSNSAPSGG